MQWNAVWARETHARIRTRNALKNLPAPVSSGARAPLVLTDHAGWALWDTTASVVDIGGRLTPDFIAHRNGHDALAVDKLRDRLGALSYAVVWNGHARALVADLKFERQPALTPDEAGSDAPQIFRFKRPPAPLPAPLPPPPVAP